MKIEEALQNYLADKTTGAYHNILTKPIDIQTFFVQIVPALILTRDVENSFVTISFEYEDCSSPCVFIQSAATTDRNVKKIVEICVLKGREYTIYRKELGISDTIDIFKRVLLTNALPNFNNKEEVWEDVTEEVLNL